jgi:secreted protein with Ig-like and vWFA domain
VGPVAGKGALRANAVGQGSAILDIISTVLFDFTPFDQKLAIVSLALLLDSGDLPLQLSLEVVKETVLVGAPNTP